MVIVCFVLFRIYVVLIRSVPRVKFCIILKKHIVKGSKNLLFPNGHDFSNTVWEVNFERYFNGHC